MSRYVGKANFGEIMAPGTGGLPVSPDMLEHLSGTEWLTGPPFLRVVLTANGNLQMLMSSWYGAKVTVAAVKNEAIPSEALFGGKEAPREYDRRVNIQTEKGVFCVASSRIVLSNPEAVEAVESGKVGVAQLFKYMKVLPHFWLNDAGVVENEGQLRLWREYVLEGNGIQCRIREDFRPNFLQMHAPEGTPSPDMEPAVDIQNKAGLGLRKLPSVEHMGNIMAGNQCMNLLADDLSLRVHPLQRCLLTSSGTTSRIIASYYLSPVQIVILRSAELPQESNDHTTTYVRRIVMVCKDVAVARAHTVARVDNPEFLEALKSKSCSIASIYRTYDLLPQFELLDVQLTAEASDEAAAGFGRRYKLCAPGIECEVHEEFSRSILDLTDVDDVPGIPRIYDLQ
mmetsp:Transcript_18217/g.33018  ORF Transcript_18217/g.33018 Transcript_18217/m.33018 type:complete len:398 (+) Transcript_18217:66-1259(+)